ncbi:ADP-ribosylglycohydrolase family protein [Pricia sp. S334]|uniref:ADP-ribosylglycohydrolase family protein n=1 Tax=Pricia mediterranea TaxID=3076079 RepID=A0ABU3L7A6_9FLAO|nr:ADP-ribosylglycohydrolase family protein [Pricia sp. S334]MDT7829243.1 ADP-ribosylglycohydrolase family protein [Pricia sp. S334]
MLFILLVTLSCKEGITDINIPTPKQTGYVKESLQLSKEVYYDKVLGALVGSAIGDAMGASTEMWHRNDIRLKYGYITGLTPAVRERSPEGTWDHNLTAGATTDDTRWKYVMTKYLSQYRGEWNPEDFAGFISAYYTSLTQGLSTGESVLDPDILDAQIEKIDWMKEWARVAMAYGEDPVAYQRALSRFYGGEMSCAGQLYTPMFGLVSPTPKASYKLAYDHSIFDIGYAKDISALVSAMTHMALRTQNMDSIIDIAIFVDPVGFQDSRLVGRIAYSVADASVKNVLTVKNVIVNDALAISDSSGGADSISTSNTLYPSGAMDFKIPKGFPGTQRDWIYQESLYRLLENDKKAIAFHAGEIWQILITALQFGEGDFEKTMQFIVNYGRDNDTVAAVAGMILGAKNGFTGLPKDLRTEVLRINKENMGIDLETLAREMAERAGARYTFARFSINL